MANVQRMERTFSNLNFSNLTFYWSVAACSLGAALPFLLILGHLLLVSMTVLMVVLTSMVVIDGPESVR